MTIDPRTRTAIIAECGAGGLGCFVAARFATLVAAAPGNTVTPLMHVLAPALVIAPLRWTAWVARYPSTGK